MGNVEINIQRYKKLIESLLRTSVVYSGESVGGHKQAFYFNSENMIDSCTSFVLITCLPEYSKDLQSGLIIQEKLSRGGVPIAKVIFKDINGLRLGIPLILVERLEGQDIEGYWNNLQVGEVPNLAIQVTKIITLSERIFTHSLTLPSLGIHLFGETPPVKNISDYFVNRLHIANTNARMRKRFKIMTFARETARLFQSKDIQALMETAPITTFIPDLIDRNFFVSNGNITGICDMDELMTGDIWLLPAVADVFLSMEGFQHRELYLKTWLNSWDPDLNDLRRMDLYRGIVAIERQSLAGTLTKTGKERKSIQSHLFNKWTNKALSLI